MIKRTIIHLQIYLVILYQLPTLTVSVHVNDVRSKEGIGQDNLFPENLKRDAIMDNDETFFGHLKNFIWSIADDDDSRNNETDRSLQTLTSSLSDLLDEGLGISKNNTPIDSEGEPRLIVVTLVKIVIVLVKVILLGIKGLFIGKKGAFIGKWIWILRTLTMSFG